MKRTTRARLKDLRVNLFGVVRDVYIAGLSPRRARKEIERMMRDPTFWARVRDGSAT